MKRFISTVLVALLVGGLAGLATYEYQNRPQPKETATVSQKAYNQAVQTTLTHDALNKVKTDQLTAQVQASDAKVASTCSQLKAAKLVNANCQ